MKYLTSMFFLTFLSFNVYAGEFAYCASQSAQVNSFSFCYKSIQGGGHERIAAKGPADMYSNGWHIVSTLVSEWKKGSDNKYASQVLFYFEK